MKLPFYTTKSAHPHEIKPNWSIIDAKDRILGRLVTKVATHLRGKNLTSYTPHVNFQQKLIIINAEKIQLTGKKLTNKQYVSHTGYPGGKRLATPQQWLQKKPTQILRNAIKGMLPKNKLGRALLKNIFLYTGTQHPHIAQKPKTLTL